MNKTVHIITGDYYLFKEQRIVYGGVQTYLTCLVPLFESRGYSCVIHQPNYKDEEVQIGSYKVIGYNLPKASSARKSSEQILERIGAGFNNDTDVLLFATETRNCKNNAKRSIAIQHGIYWDIPQHEDYSPKKNALYIFKKMFNAYDILIRNNYVKRIVCVDYNFLNWYKAVSAYPAIPMSVIPNFTKIAPICDKPKDIVSIMFARRLRRYRGANLFADAIVPVLARHQNVNLTIAGIGPEEEYMRKKLADYMDRVVFTQYKAEESLDIHKDKHIAVVPTVGSEGTSLSLLEAMSAQCAVICTSTGGLSNIVIDEYNGLIVSPNQKSLEQALEKLIANNEFRQEIAKRGYETVKYGFSFEKWKDKWLEVIDDMISE